MRKLTEQQILTGATRLGCDVASIKAVVEVESRGDGFFDDGRPVLLYEAHIFSRLTKHVYDAEYPNLSSKSWNRKLYKGGPAEYGRLYQAMQLNADAAIQACSWGLFQVMGFNWAACGERSLLGFLMAMHNDEGAQLQLFCQFVKSQGLDDELRRHDWAGFARGYNGASYKANQYDTKLAAAYRRHST